MLSEKPWNVEAIVRMLLGVFICLCLGSVVVSGFHYAGHAGKEQVAFFAMLAAAVGMLAAALGGVSQRWTLEGLLRRVWAKRGFLFPRLSFSRWAPKTAAPRLGARFRVRKGVAES